VVNHTIVTDPTIWQLGFDLTRHMWSLLNRFRSGQGPFRANLHIWGLIMLACETMNRIVDTYPLTKFEGRLQLLYKAEENTVKWLEPIVTIAFVK